MDRRGNWTLACCVARAACVGYEWAAGTGSFREWSWETSSTQSTKTPANLSNLINDGVVRYQGWSPYYELIDPGIPVLTADRHQQYHTWDVLESPC